MKKTLVVIFCLVAFGLAFQITPAKAKTVEDLQAMINNLLAQIAQLQAKIKEMQEGGSATEWCYTFNKNLRIGDNGTEITHLKTALQKAGFYSSDDSDLSSSDFTERIASFVVAFQEKYKEKILGPYGLKHGTGYVGPTTRAKLNELYGCENKKVCAQVITYAKNQKTGECKQFPTPCNVPAGWVKVSSCPVTTPSITVISPNGGEKYVIGTGYLYIKYTASNIPIGQEVTAYLKDSKGSVQRTALETVKNDGVNTISMNMELASSEEPGQYKIKVCTTGKGAPINACDTSDNYFNIVSPTYSCSDTDGGKDYYTKGYITVNNIKSEDECNPGPNTTADTLLEYYCTGDNNEPGLGITYICPNGCKDGACQATPTSSCIDSDGGINYYVKGVTDINPSDQGGEATDYCDGTTNQLIEYYCTSDGSNGGASSLFYTCPYGCENGICKATSTPSITVVSPNGEEELIMGQTYNITWSLSNIERPKVDLYKDGSWQTIVGTWLTPTESYSWTVPTNLPVSNNYKIRVSDYHDPGIFDESDNEFTITKDTACTENLNCSYLADNCFSAVDKYDTDNDGKISMSEELATVNSYLYGDATKDEFCCVLNVWKGGCDFSSVNNGLGLIESQVADISKAISDLIEEIKKLLTL